MAEVEKPAASETAPPDRLAAMFDRIRISAPGQERSLQWGSDRAAAEQLLEGVGPEDVIEDVLAMVAAPL